MTGASSSHFRSLLQFLRSVRRYEPGIRCLVYSLGLTEGEMNRLSRAFPWAELRIFDFSAHPAFFDMSRDNGSYAWKPAILWEALREGAPACWMDSGNALVGDLARLRSALARTGFYSPSSPGTVGQWTHPGMLAFLGLDPLWGRDIPNLNGACMAFDPRSERALRLARRWAELASEERCIAPEGANRENHRYDQALLTILANIEDLARTSEHDYLGFKLHQDVETRPLRAILRSLKRTLAYWRYALEKPRLGARGRTSEQ